MMLALSQLPGGGHADDGEAGSTRPSSSAPWVSQHPSTGSEAAASAPAKELPPLAVLSPELLPRVTGSFSWRVVTSCFLVVGGDVGLQIDTAPLPLRDSAPSRESYAIFSGYSRDGALGRARARLLTRTADGVLNRGDFIVDVRQVAPAEIAAARRADAVVLLASGASPSPDPRHSCLGSAAIPGFSPLFEEAPVAYGAVAAAREPLAIPLRYERFKLTPGDSSARIIQAVRAAADPAFGGSALVSDAAWQRPPGSGLPSEYASAAAAAPPARGPSYAEALGLPSFYGSCIQVVGLRYCPELTRSAVAWRPPAASPMNSFLGRAVASSASSLFSPPLGVVQRRASAAEPGSVAALPTLGKVDIVEAPRRRQAPSTVIMLSDDSDDGGAEASAALESAQPAAAPGARASQRPMKMHIAVPLLSPPPAAAAAANGGSAGAPPAPAARLLPAKRPASGGLPQAERTAADAGRGIGRVRPALGSAASAYSDEEEAGAERASVASAAAAPAPAAALAGARPSRKAARRGRPPMSFAVGAYSDEEDDSAAHEGAVMAAAAAPAPAAALSGSAARRAKPPVGLAVGSVSDEEDDAEPGGVAAAAVHAPAAAPAAALRPRTRPGIVARLIAAGPAVSARSKVAPPPLPRPVSAAKVAAPPRVPVQRPPMRRNQGAAPLPSAAAGDPDPTADLVLVLNDAPVNECVVCLEELEPAPGGRQRWRLEPCGHSQICGSCVAALSTAGNRTNGKIPPSANIHGRSAEGAALVFARGAVTCPVCRRVGVRATAVRGSAK